MPGTANYHFGFLRWSHLGLREGGATYPSAQQETGHQLQERWGCSMDLAWKRLQEGTQLLLPCLLRTLKKKKRTAVSITPASHRPTQHMAETCTSPTLVTTQQETNNWTNEMTRTNLNFSKLQKPLRGI